MIDPGPVRVKICGLKTREVVLAACDAGAAYVGFNFFQRSPRSVSVAEAADLSLSVTPGVVKVGLVVDPDDAELDELLARVPLDMIQLHGSETPERVRAVKSRTGLPVMKAVGVREAKDLAALEAHGRIADQILVDAKPPKGATLPGGNGVAFDWELIAGRRWPVPWMLAGGLTAANVAEALRLTGARQVDLASGVETAPGVKDPGMIADFMAAVVTEGLART